MRLRAARPFDERRWSRCRVADAVNHDNLVRITRCPLDVHLSITHDCGAERREGVHCIEQSQASLSKWSGHTKYTKAAPIRTFSGMQVEDSTIEPTVVIFKRRGKAFPRRTPLGLCLKLSSELE